MRTSDVLNTFLQRMRTRALRSITRFYSERYLPEAVPAPSGRFGIYSIAAEVFSPGDHVLISPLTCHTVIESLLAARVVPTFVEINRDTGTIDVARLTRDVLGSAKGVITTNLYGNPDDADELAGLAHRHGLWLIEDCAHVLHTTIAGRAIGSFGDAAVFSFRKYFAEGGAVVAVRSRRLAENIVRRIEREAEPAAQNEEVARFLEHGFTSAAGTTIARVLKTAARRLTPFCHIRAADKTADDAAARRAATFPTTAALLRVRNCLARFEQLVDARIRAADELVRAVPLPPRRSVRAETMCYMAVPFWTPKRNHIIAAMDRRGIPTYFTYSPPMNRRFAGRAQTEFLTESEVDEWCRHILPVSLERRREYAREIAE